MKKPLLWLSIAIAALGAFGCMPKSAPSTVPLIQQLTTLPAVSVTPVPAQWKMVQTFEGESYKNTPNFDLSSNEWRISWQATPGKMGEGLFSFEVFRADGSMLDLVANIVGSGEDVSYMKEAGSFYLKIMASEKYKITIESQ